MEGNQTKEMKATAARHGGVSARQNELIDAYLLNIGVDPNDTEMPPVESIQYRTPNDFAIEGWDYDPEQYEYFRASRTDDGRSVKAARAVGFRFVGHDADVRMPGVPDGLMMRRSHEVAQRYREVKEQELAERRESLDAERRENLDNNNVLTSRVVGRNRN